VALLSLFTNTVDYVMRVLLLPVDGMSLGSLGMASRIRTLPQAQQKDYKVKEDSKE
jgi:hypothetical protein